MIKLNGLPTTANQRLLTFVAGYYLVFAFTVWCSRCFHPEANPLINILNECLACRQSRLCCERTIDWKQAPCFKQAARSFLTLYQSTVSLLFWRPTWESLFCGMKELDCWCSCPRRSRWAVQFCWKFNNW